MIKPLIYVDVKKALKMSMISQHPSLYSEQLRISFEIAYRLLTRSWYGGNVNRKTTPAAVLCTIHAISAYVTPEHL